MNVNDFVTELKNLCNDKTVYMLGTIGQNVTNVLINSCAKRLPKFYTKTKINQLKGFCGKSYHAFDCCGMIKAVLWGYTVKNHTCNYCSNGIPDCNETTLINDYCDNVSNDFSKIEIGECVWLPGHIGVYIGDGVVIECTPKWKNAVQYSICLNNSKRTDYPGRYWVKHGRLKCLSGYMDKLPETNKDGQTLVIDGSWGALTTRRLQQIFGTTVDGFVSSQPVCNRDFVYKNCINSFEWVNNKKATGSDLILQIQIKIGDKWRDGYAGRDFWLSLSKYLYPHYFEFLPVAYASPTLVKALQKWANDQ